MSAIQAMDIATAHPTMPVPGSTGSGAAAAGHPFAEVMRSAVSIAQTARKASDASRVPGASRTHFKKSSLPADTGLDQVHGSVSNSSSQAGKGDPSIETENPSQESDVPESIVSSSAATDGVAASPAVGQTQSSFPITATQDPSSGVAPRIRTDAAKNGSSSTGIGQKPSSPIKEASRSGGTSGSCAIATTTSALVPSIHAITETASSVKLPGEQVAGWDATGFTSVLKSVGNQPESKNPSAVHPTTAPLVSTHVSQGDGATGMAGMLLHQAAGDFTDAGAGSQHAASTRGVQTIEAHSSATPNTGAVSSTASSSANPKSDITGNAPASQPVVAGSPAFAQTGTNGVATVTADANPTNSVGDNASGNLGAAGNDTIANGGNPGNLGNTSNGAAISIHGGDGLRSASVSSAIFPSATPAKDLPASHASPADSSVGFQNTASVLSSGSHSGAIGIPSSSTSAATVTRATAVDAFTALDSAAAGERGVLLHAAPHQVAVGISDPLLGWVEVKAERISGQIAAALTANSSASHAALTSVLPTMATYLQEHHAGVQQVHVEASLTGGQAGAGSQGQSPSNGDARTAADNRAVAESVSSGWNAAPRGTGIIPMSQGTNFLNEEHRFSIRA